jgi:membrane-bound serine protease (ClpP class)
LGQKLLLVLSNPNIAAILATLAMLLIYFELHTPGIHVAGGLGVICLVISFMAFQTLPIRTGGLTLMGAGLLLMIGEVFATAHGAMAVGGVLSFILGMIWVVDPSQTTNVVSAVVWVPAALALGSGSILIGWIATRIKKQTHEARIAIKGGGQGGLQGYEVRVESLAGGQALLSPFGRVQVRGELWEFVSEDPVKVGDFVKIDQVQGLKLRVSRVLTTGKS